MGGLSIGLLLESMPLLPEDTSPSERSVRLSPHYAPGLQLLGQLLLPFNPFFGGVLPCVDDIHGVVLPNCCASNCYGCRQYGVVLLCHLEEMLSYRRYI